MINLEHGNLGINQTAHFCVLSDEAIRIEVNVDKCGHVVVFVYRGIVDDLEQEPDLIVDSDDV